MCGQLRVRFLRLAKQRVDPSVRAVIHRRELANRDCGDHRGAGSAGFRTLAGSYSRSKNCPQHGANNRAACRPSSEPDFFRERPHGGVAIAHGKTDALDNGTDEVCETVPLRDPDEAGTGIAIDKWTSFACFGNEGL